MFVINGTVFYQGKFEKKDIRVEQGRFSGIGEPGSIKNAVHEDEVMDASGKYILPGLVDIHSHGRIGEDFSKLTEDGLRELLFSYARCGVTSLLGTTMTNELSAVEKSLKIMGDRIKQQEREKGRSDFARLSGIHMEGPFFGTEKRGAHDTAYLWHPDWELFLHWQKLCGGNIRLVALDPELSGAEKFIEKCAKVGVKVSLGHTGCTYETAVKARRLGADHVTHVFNGMSALNHREPGLPGAALDTEMYTELICDGIHVHPAVVRLLFAAHPEQMVLISDSITPAGMADGEYESGGFLITVKDGKAVLADGTIAGSTISLFDAMVNAIRFGVPKEMAVNSATFLPAKSVGIDHIAGSIEVGRHADFLVVNREWKLEKVIISN